MTKDHSNEIIHLGGENCVTGSCHLIRTFSGIHILVDCGMVQGGDFATPMADWPVSPDRIDYLFITHTHIDHCGRVPELLERGFKGEIICTHPTRKLLFPMLRDAMSFSDMSRGAMARIDRKIDDLSWGFEYDAPFDLKKGIRFKLGRAGHILGSCFIQFQLPEKEGGLFSVIFSGDLGNYNTPILPDPDPPGACDLLILESTYGDRDHEKREDRIRNLERMLEKALADNGKVFIPAFALGRTQELIYEIDRIKTEHGRFASIPVFIDSPLGLEITGIYSAMNEFWDKESRELLEEGDHPIDFEALYAVESHRSHKKLMETDGPAVIIAGNGMCSGGRIVNHLADGIDDEKNDVFFVGYQARGTTGRKIMKYAKRKNGWVYLKNEKRVIKANVRKLTGYSAHADQTGLIDWISSAPAPPREIKLVHGEPRAKESLAARINNDLGIEAV